MKPDAGLVVDHINHDKNDNRRENLRVCTRRENMLNQQTRSDSKTGLKGVLNRRGRYYAYIKLEGRQEHLGVFSTKEEAAMAYDTAARKVYGEFACTNF